jgi:hypothetical protein
MQEHLASGLVQVVLGIMVLAVVYYFALATAMQDQLVQTNAAPKSITPIVDGKAPLNLSFVTDKRLTMSGRDIVHIPRSQNAGGGAQFSYSFWVKLPPSGDVKRVVLYRGDKTVAKFTNVDNSREMSFPMTYCPMVVVSRKSGDVKVSCHVNATKDRNFSCVAMSKSGDTVNWSMWNLITVSVEDTSLYGAPTPGALSCTVWVNQVPTKRSGTGGHTATVQSDSAVRTGGLSAAAIGGVLENSGDLYVLPTDAFGHMQCHGVVDLRDLVYANYAMKTSEIRNKLAGEADKTVATYKIHRTDTSSQAFWDMSMKHLSV